MHNILPVADSGLVRLGAGMRRVATPVRATQLRAATSARPAAQPAPAAIRQPISPAAVIDAGRVRLGAGMRRI